MAEFLNLDGHQVVNLDRIAEILLQEDGAVVLILDRAKSIRQELPADSPAAALLRRWVPAALGIAAGTYRADEGDWEDDR